MKLVSLELKYLLSKWQVAGCKFEIFHDINKTESFSFENELLCGAIKVAVTNIL